MPDYENHKTVMRVRADLKKEIVNLNDLVHDYASQISFKDKIPGDEELAAKRAEKSAALDGMNYAEVLKRIFTITDVIQDLNVAIEKANRDVQNSKCVKKVCEYLEQTFSIYLLSTCFLRKQPSSQSFR